MTSNNPSSSADTLVTIKVSLSNGENRRFKLPLRELGAAHLTDRLREILEIAPTQDVLFERFSDSAGAYITLDSNNPAVYKQLYRAAKAKLKLRIKVSVADTALPKLEIVQPELPCDRLNSHCFVPPSIDGLENKNPAAIVGTACCSPISPPVHSTAVKPRVDFLATKTQRLRHAYAINLQHELSMKAAKGSVSSLTPKSSPDATVEATVETTADATSDAAKGAGKTVSENEAPVPGFFSARQHFYAELANMARDHPSPLRSAGQECPVISAPFTICCNNCDAAIPSVHWHCSICDNGDFDLCVKCVEKGVLCDTSDHWLIKRFLEGGKVITSTTETIAPKKDVRVASEEVSTQNDVGVESEKGKPGAFASDNKLINDEYSDEGRVCNSCVNGFEETNFVTCTVCEDYDLCIPCHVSMKHGHHPSHRLEPTSKETKLNATATMLCAPGRNMQHFATCDGCDKDIFGVRHKCLNCPDWDYCSTCIKTARQEHPHHRFVPIFEPIRYTVRDSQRHYGVHCDGPLCKDSHSYIHGDRYKCAICHDTDFCAKCEALPIEHHNRTHPLIKFKSPVRSAFVITLGEKENGEHMYRMGDQTPQTSSKSTETTPPAASANAATQVQTTAELKPTVPVSSGNEEPKTEATKTPLAPELQANFVRDIIPDGTVLAPCVPFRQVWTVRNPGPNPWPAGCSVRFTGGDGMFNVDSNHPSSSSDIVKATESNVIDRIVEMGEEVDFAVLMKTPENEGRVISYWRLKAADGVSFGHKLWCDVTVRIPEPVSEFETTTNDMEDVPWTKQIKDLPKVEREEFKEEESQSQMIFPKLDKESPISSTHEAESTSAVIATEEEPEDVEILGSDEDDSDDGFLTDDEYELLNTSDEELMEARNGRK